MLTGYPIERGIPIPPPRKPGGSQRKYPWRQLAIGESFFAANVVITSLTNCAASSSMKTGYKYTIRTVDGGVRVWRTA